MDFAAPVLREPTMHSIQESNCVLATARCNSQKEGRIWLDPQEIGRLKRINIVLQIDRQEQAHCLVPLSRQKFPAEDDLPHEAAALQLVGRENELLGHVATSCYPSRRFIAYWTPRRSA